MTRSGVMQAFRPGVLRVHEGTDVPVIPVYLDELGAVFSVSGWPIPLEMAPQMALSYFHSLRSSGTRPSREYTRCVKRSRILEQKPCNSELTKCPPSPRLHSVLQEAKPAVKVADSTGTQLTGGSLLMRSLILRRLLRREVLADDEHERRHPAAAHGASRWS